MPKLVFLATDVALYGLVAAIAFYVWHALRTPTLRQTWGSVLRDPAAMSAAVVLLDSAVLAAQYVVTAYGPESDPLSGRLLDSQLDVTVFRVALVPAALLAVAVPVFAGLALRADRPAPHPPSGRPEPDRAPSLQPAGPG